MAQGLQEKFGQPFIVENRPGAGSTVGNMFVARSPGDGYTFLITSSHFSIVPSLYKLQYDPQKDLRGVSLLVNIPVILVANPKVPAANVRVTELRGELYADGTWQARRDLAIEAGIRVGQQHEVVLRAVSLDEVDHGTSLRDDQCGHGVG